MKSAPVAGRSGYQAAMVLLLAWQALAVESAVGATTLAVGPGKRYPRIEDANAVAQPGDTILVYPAAGGAYEQAAVDVRQKNLTFQAVRARGAHGVKISGKGFDYSGAGSTPRAIFQFNRGADNCVLEGFELAHAHNDSHNGAGVRINQANHVTIRRCSIHHNDMGIMSNGGGGGNSAVDQRIEFCEIHHNGDPEEPGQNHNLYLGGISAMLSFCEVHSSLTGHNVKSRAHHTRVQYCYVHHSANREFDLVDAEETARPQSHAVLLGNIIVKDPECAGNHSVIHFGQDGGRRHDGTLHLLCNTIVTPFQAPILELSAPAAKAHLTSNLIVGSSQSRQRLAAARFGARLQNITGSHNWLIGNFGTLTETGLDPKANVVRRTPVNLFVDPQANDYHLNAEAAAILKSHMSAVELEIPPMPGMTAPVGVKEPPLAWQYHHPAGKEKRPAEKGLAPGAYARAAATAGRVGRAERAPPETGDRAKHRSSP
jgi:hypothetical protein